MGKDRELVNMVHGYIDRPPGRRVVHIAGVHFETVYGSKKIFFPFCGAGPGICRHTAGTWVFTTIGTITPKNGDRFCKKCSDVYRLGMGTKTYRRFLIVGGKVYR